MTDDPATLARWLHFGHITGVIVYAGGVIAQSRLLSLLAGAPVDGRAATAAAARRVHLRLLLPAGLLMIGAGTWLLVADPEAKHYLKQPAFHLKLTLVVILLTIEHLLVLRPLRGLALGTADPATNRALFRAGHPLVVLLVLAILFALFFLRPAA